MADDPDDEAPPTQSALDFVIANLESMATTLPSLLERVRAQAQASGQLAAVDAKLPAGDGQRIAAFAAYLDLFGRPGPDEARVVELRPLAERALALVRAEVAPRARLALRAERSPPVRAGERQLGQLLVSLVLNGAEAIAAGDPAQHEVALLLGRGDDGWARIEVHDDGHGIPADLLPRIFDPFFSTKRGRGAGIGLAVVRATVQALGGRLSVASEPGRGTCFRVELPPA